MRRQRPSIGVHELSNRRFASSVGASGEQLFLNRHDPPQGVAIYSPADKSTANQAHASRSHGTPADATDPASKRRSASRTRRRRSVLVVEDDEDARELLVIILTAAGCQVSTAADGRAGLEAASTKGIDLVVTDIAMPRMDGIQMVRQLRQRPATRDIPVIAFTGQAVADIPALAQAAGCDCVLSKPCCPDDVMSVINQYIGSRRSDRSRSTQRDQYRGHDRRRRLPL
jgi:CheY-like chemotaxis protein